MPDRRVRRRGRPQPPLAGGAVVSVAAESVDANTGETWSVPRPQALIWGSTGTTTYEVSFGGVISTCDATEQPVAPEMTSLYPTLKYAVCSGANDTSVTPTFSKANPPEGSRNSSTRIDQPKLAQRSSPSMALSFLYRLVRRVFEAVRVHRLDAAAKDAEILVLRHQLAVLRRQVDCPRFTWSDRAFVALIACLVPRECWRSFLVTPQTIGLRPAAWSSPRVEYPLTSEAFTLEASQVAQSIATTDLSTRRVFQGRPSVSVA